MALPPPSLPQTMGALLDNGRLSFSQDGQAVSCPAVDAEACMVLDGRPGGRGPSPEELQLRDGRKIIGIMRSFDQFANVVLEEAVERIIVGKKFADVPLGLYVIRGENVVLLGPIVRALPFAGKHTDHSARHARACRWRGTLLRG